MSSADAAVLLRKDSRGPLPPGLGEGAKARPTREQDACATHTWPGKPRSWHHRTGKCCQVNRRSLRIHGAHRRTGRRRAGQGQQSGCQVNRRKPWVDVAHRRHTLHVAGHVQRTPTVCNVDPTRSHDERSATCPGVQVEGRKATFLPSQGLKVAFLPSRAQRTHPSPSTAPRMRAQGTPDRPAGRAAPSTDSHPSSRPGGSWRTFLTFPASPSRQRARRMGAGGTRCPPAAAAGPKARTNGTFVQ